VAVGRVILVNRKCNFSTLTRYVVFCVFVVVSRSWLSCNTRGVGPDSWSVQRTVWWFSWVRINVVQSLVVELLNKVQKFNLKFDFEIQIRIQFSGIQFVIVTQEHAYKLHSRIVCITSVWLPILHSQPARWTAVT